MVRNFLQMYSSFSIRDLEREKIPYHLNESSVSRPFPRGLRMKHLIDYKQKVQSRLVGRLNSENPFSLCNGYTNRIFPANGKHPRFFNNFRTPAPLKYLPHHLRISNDFPQGTVGTGIPWICM